MSMQLIQKVDSSRRITVGMGVSKGKKDKIKQIHINEWGIKLPQGIQTHVECMAQHDQLVVNNNNNNNSNQQLQQTIDGYIHEVIDNKFSLEALQSIMDHAHQSSLSHLWNIQYTNKLSLIKSIINQTLTKNKQKTTTPLKHTQQQQQNKNSSNHQSQEQQEQSNIKDKDKDDKKNKKKIKKHPQHKQQHKTQTIQKKQLTPFQMNVANQINKLLDTKQHIQLTLHANLVISKIQTEIQRVQHLLLQEIQNVHVLPYTEAKSKLLQSQNKVIKKTTNNNKLNPEKSYPLEGYQKQHFNNNQFYPLASHHLSQSTLNNSNRQLHQQQNINFPLINQDYQITHNNPHLNQSQYQYITEQHMKTFPISLMSMNPNFTHQMTQINPQYIHSQGMYPNLGYQNDNFMVMGGGNMGQSKINTQRIHVESRKQGNMIDIQIDDDDQVEQIGSKINKN